MYKSIAIDGPAGAGKSTISKKLANKIGFDYLDTGAMYRSFTYYYLENNIDLNDENAINDNISNIDLDFIEGKFFLNGKDVSQKIRGKKVNNNVSLISSYKKVREHLVDLQRKIASKSNIIVDGRDIGSHVLVDASIKFFLTASAEVRAKRRLDEISNPDIKLEDILDEINKRDYLDSNREISPLTKASDAILVDSSNLEIDEVVDLMISLMEEKGVI